MAAAHYSGRRPVAETLLRRRSYSMLKILRADPEDPVCSSGEALDRP